MTSTIDLNTKSSPCGSDLTGNVHLLPCSIKHNGRSEISHYFKPKNTDIVVDGFTVKEAYFRGRKLQGAAIRIPEGYRGYVLDKKKMKKHKGGDTEDSIQWESKAEFGNITYWNHDNIPSSCDPFLKCFDWFSISHALHKPITHEEITSFPCKRGSLTA